MKANIFEALTIIPCKLFSGIGWVVMLFSVLKPDEVEGLIDSVIKTEQIQIWSIVFFMAFTAYWIIVFFFKPQEDDKELATSINQTSLGDYSPNIAGNYTVNKLPLKFSEEQTVNTLPEHMGGVKRLNLGGVGSLKLHVPCSKEMVTLALDAVPIKFPDKVTPHMEVREFSIMTGPVERLEFNNMENKRQNIHVGDKVFIVTLTNIEILEVEGVANPISYTFKVAEQ